MTTPKQSQNPPDLKILFIHQLNRVNCTKGYLIRNLPILEEIASFKNMKLAIQEDLDDVKKQQVRIDKMYNMLHSKASDEGCDVIKSILEEAFNLGNNAGKSTIVNDMDIILYMQLIENIELTSFRMLKLIAEFMGDEQIIQMVTECFDENVDNDKLFTLITEEYLSKKTNGSK
jgi:ferritin-like metal-binding protein YciE